MGKIKVIADHDNIVANCENVTRFDIEELGLKDVKNITLIELEGIDLKDTDLSELDFFYWNKYDEDNEKYDEDYMDEEEDEWSDFISDVLFKITDCENLSGLQGLPECLSRMTIENTSVKDVNLDIDICDLNFIKTPDMDSLKISGNHRSISFEKCNTEGMENEAYVELGISYDRCNDNNYSVHYNYKNDFNDDESIEFYGDISALDFSNEDREIYFTDCSGLDKVNYNEENGIYSAEFTMHGIHFRDGVDWKVDITELDLSNFPGSVRIIGETKDIVDLSNVKFGKKIKELVLIRCDLTDIGLSNFEGELAYEDCTGDTSKADKYIEKYNNENKYDKIISDTEDTENDIEEDDDFDYDDFYESIVNEEI